MNNHQSLTRTPTLHQDWEGRHPLKAHGDCPVKMKIESGRDNAEKKSSSLISMEIKGSKNGRSQMVVLD